MDEVLVQDSFGQRWLFACNSQGQLTCRTADMREVLQPDMSSVLDAMPDAAGNIHLAVQDAAGSLVYLYYDGSAWRKYPMLCSKTGQRCITQITLVPAGSRPYAIYQLRHGVQQLLVCQTMVTGSTLCTPQVIDRVMPGRRYAMAFDGQLCHLLYFDRENILQYRTAPAAEGSWSASPAPIEGDVAEMGAMCPAGGQLQLAYITRRKNEDAIHYCPAGESPRQVAGGLCRPAAPTLFAIGERVTVQWQQGWRVMECTAIDGGSDFPPPRDLSAIRGAGVRLCRVRVPGQSLHRCACEGLLPLGCSRLLAGENARLTALTAQLTQTQAEVARLRQLVDHILPPPQTELPPEHIGEVDRENYEKFQQMTVEDMDFSAGQTF